MIYAVSDIHGNLSCLIALLEHVNFAKEDHLYVIGDMIDWGRDNIGSMMFVKSLENATALMGNHELMMIETLNSVGDEAASCGTFEGILPHLGNWERNGGYQTLREFTRLSEEDRFILYCWLRNIKLTVPSLVVGKDTYYLAHAYPRKTDANWKIESRNDAYLYGIQRIVWKRMTDYANPFEGAHHNKILIYGHTPTSNQGYKIFKNLGSRKIGIDCGAKMLYDRECCKLALLNINEMTATYVNSKGVVWDEEV